jgi:Carboxypeptidase regulatory-like domain
MSMWLLPTSARRAGWVALVFGMVGQGAWAQATLRGVVKAKGGSVLTAAEVVLEPNAGRAKSDAEGRFAIERIRAGEYTITVRAVGYRPLEADAELRGTDTLSVTFELEPAPQQLAPIRVEAPAAPPVVAKMMAFEERRKAGFGRFFTRIELEKMEHRVLSDVLRIAGVSMIRRRFECGDGFAPASSRGSLVMKWWDWMECSGLAMPPACYMTIYLDGIVIWDWGDHDIPDIGKYQVNSLEGIEVYRGAAQEPIELQKTNSACGAVLLWTRN